MNIFILKDQNSIDAHASKKIEHVECFSSWSAQVSTGRDLKCVWKKNKKAQEKIIQWGKKCHLFQSL